MKRRYKCSLEGFNDVGHGHLLIAYIRRLENHAKLGPPTMGLTHTSLIVRIDFEKKEIETLNSIYYWEN